MIYCSSGSNLGKVSNFRTGSRPYVAVKSCLFNVRIVTQNIFDLTYLTFVFYFMLDPDPNPDLQCILVPVPLRPSAIPAVPVPQH
jgi:hypothetical protein